MSAHLDAEVRRHLDEMYRQYLRHAAPGRAVEAERLPEAGAFESDGDQEEKNVTARRLFLRVF